MVFETAGDTAGWRKGTSQTIQQSTTLSYLSAKKLSGEDESEGRGDVRGQYDSKQLLVNKKMAEWDEDVQGVGRDEMVEAVVLQKVSEKNCDEFLIAVVQ